MGIAGRPDGQKAPREGALIDESYTRVFLRWSSRVIAPWYPKEEHCQDTATAQRRRGHVRPQPRDHRFLTLMT